jgi:hypothetical protein
MGLDHVERAAARENARLAAEIAKALALALR